MPGLSHIPELCRMYSLVAKSELAKLSSGQTGTKQEVAIGSLRQQSEGSNAVNFAESVVGAAVRAAVGK